MTSPIVSRDEAHKKRTHHQFVPGLGYLAHSGPPDLPPTAKGTMNCAPPAGTKDGSAHVMRPPYGAAEMTMLWVAGEQAWAPSTPGKGNRLAWPPAHLSRAGWEYVGPVDGAPKAKPKKKS